MYSPTNITWPVACIGCGKTNVFLEKFEDNWTETKKAGVATIEYRTFSLTAHIFICPSCKKFAQKKISKIRKIEWSISVILIILMIYLLILFPLYLIIIIALLCPFIGLFTFPPLGYKLHKYYYKFKVNWSMEYIIFKFKNEEYAKIFKKMNPLQFVK
ncbi:MAG: hypothetical protein ACTSPD_08170 [Promethearchaeota archaeon]